MSAYAESSVFARPRARLLDLFFVVDDSLMLILRAVSVEIVLVQDFAFCAGAAIRSAAVVREISFSPFPLASLVAAERHILM